MAGESTVTIIRYYLRALAEKGLPVSYGVLFGSHVRGKDHAWSDIDLLVVSPRFDEKYRRTDVNLLWRVAARTDSRIEPIGVGERQFAEDDSSATIEIARREGRRIFLQNGEAKD